MHSADYKINHVFHDVLMALSGLDSSCVDRMTSFKMADENSWNLATFRMLTVTKNDIAPFIKHKVNRIEFFIQVPT